MTKMESWRATHVASCNVLSLSNVRIAMPPAGFLFRCSPNPFSTGRVSR
jgi:hypothetical protein